MSAAPWRIVTDRLGNPQHMIAESGGAVCSFLTTVWRNCGPEQVTANARLIAAAPDLLAVVKELEESAAYWGEYDVPLGIVDRLRDAIAKATGEGA